MSITLQMTENNNINLTLLQSLPSVRVSLHKTRDYYLTYLYYYSVSFTLHVTDNNNINLTLLKSLPSVKVSLHRERDSYLAYFYCQGVRFPLHTWQTITKVVNLELLLAIRISQQEGKQLSTTLDLLSGVRILYTR